MHCADRERLPRVIVFAKRPLPGRVKTRLVPALGEVLALALYRAFVADQLRWLVGLADRYAVELCVDEPWDLAFEGLVRGSPVAVTLQGSGDLGARLARAFGRAAASGAPRTVVVGADSPTLPNRIVATAFRSLRAADAVVSPADDGGYVLLGMRRAVPELLRGIPWGTGGVLAETRRRATLGSRRLVEIEGWFDVDDAAGLERLRCDLRRRAARSRAPCTAALLRGDLPVDRPPASMV